MVSYLTTKIEGPKRENAEEGDTPETVADKKCVESSGQKSPTQGNQQPETVVDEKRVESPEQKSPTQGNQHNPKAVVDEKRVEFPWQKSLTERNQHFPLFIRMSLEDRRLNQDAQTESLPGLEFGKGEMCVLDFPFEKMFRSQGDEKEKLLELLSMSVSTPKIRFVHCCHPPFLTM